MKKIIQLLGLSLVLLSCTKELDFSEVKSDDSKNAVSRAVGDGVYEALGYGYDITDEYLGENSVRLAILDVEKFVQENKGRFYNPFVGIIDQRINAGENSLTFIRDIINKSNFNGSVASMGLTNTDKGFFSGTITSGFESKTKYSYSSKYSFARAEVFKKQRQYYLHTDTETLSKYLSSVFVEDLNKYSADKIIEMYGTHVLTDITVGGRYMAYYKSAIIKVDTKTEKTKTVGAGVKFSLNKMGLDLNGSWSSTEIVETSKQNSNWSCKIKALGGSTSGTIFTLTPNQSSTTTINLGAWTESVDDTHSRLIDVNWNKTYPIYDLISDPKKKAELKAAVERYIDSKKLTFLELTPLYAVYWSKGVNCHWVTSWNEVVKYINEGHDYNGVFGYINTNSTLGARPLYKMYWPKGKNTHYITSWDEVGKFQSEGHEYQGIIGYIYIAKEENTIPVHILYYPKGRDSHWETTWAATQSWINNRGDQYGGILGYIYPSE